MNTTRVFNHYLHVKFVLLGIVQGLLFVASVYVAAQIRFLGQSTPETEDPQVLLPKALTFALIVLFSMGAMGIFHPQRRAGHLQVVVRLLAAFAFSWPALVIVFYLLPSLFVGRGVLAIASVISLLGTLAIQAVFYLLIDQRMAPWRVVFYGAGDNASAILAYLRRRTDRRLFTLVGCILAPGETARVSPDLVCGVDSTLLSFARERNIDEVVVAMDDLRHEFPADELLACRMAGINVVDTLTFYERQTGKVKTDLLRPSWIIFSEGFRANPLQDLLKRCMDLLIALILLLTLWPFMLLTALAIRIEDGSGQPLFYSQQRIGRFGHVFSIYKFRSMSVNAEVAGVAQWASVNDPRVTRVGEVIRKYRLDELPQLLNVIKGNMSMVGPRPERPEFVDELAMKLPYFRVREQVKPGLTGWAQLGYPYGASEDDANAKLQLDLYYVKNRSTFLDLLILLGTAEVVLFRKGGR